MKDAAIDHQTLLGLVRYKAEGLVPCVVQDARSGEVLMVAYANAEALGATLDNGGAILELLSGSP